MVFPLSILFPFPHGYCISIILGHHAGWANSVAAVHKGGGIGRARKGKAARWRCGERTPADSGAEDCPKITRETLAPYMEPHLFERSYIKQFSLRSPQDKAKRRLAWPLHKDDTLFRSDFFLCITHQDVVHGSTHPNLPSETHLDPNWPFQGRPHAVCRHLVHSAQLMQTGGTGLLTWSTLVITDGPSILRPTIFHKFVAGCIQYIECHLTLYPKMFLTANGWLSGDYRSAM
ncbi:hypothetical protein HD554DRAFT_2042395 [Boletus coccyginus]|nr:hypothetical protein HD554DRAFT_2042395 [Boletus coccyginus]